MYGTYGHMFGNGMALGGFWMILVWAIPLLLVALLFKFLIAGKPRDDGRYDGSDNGRSAFDILKEAYARGELSREDFLQKRDDLLER